MHPYPKNIRSEPPPPPQTPEYRSLPEDFVALMGGGVCIFRPHTRPPTPPPQKKKNQKKNHDKWTPSPPNTVDDRCHTCLFPLSFPQSPRHVFFRTLSSSSLSVYRLHAYAGQGADNPLKCQCAACEAQKKHVYKIRQGQWWDISLYKICFTVCYATICNIGCNTASVHRRVRGSSNFWRRGGGGGGQTFPQYWARKGWGAVLTLS